MPEPRSFVASSGKAKLTVRLPRALRRRLAHARSVRLTVTVRALIDGQEAPPVRRRLTLRR